MSRRKSERRSTKCLLGVFIFLCFQEWIPQEQTLVYAKKTATRSGLVASTQLGGGGNSATDFSAADEYSGAPYDEPENSSLLTPARRLQKDLTRNYDKMLPPVNDVDKSIKIVVDLTYRQVLDLDEKNQILKSLIWYRQYWHDENLMWMPENYGGITETTIPATVVWRPDIAVYEEVAARDFNPRLPYVKVQSDGEILLAEPTILETSCRVNTAFFPFDSQLCTMTFVSWTQPLTHIDLRAKRSPETLKEQDLALFIDSGEWVLTDFSVSKQVTRYDILAKDNETKVQSTQLKHVTSSGTGVSSRVDPTRALEPWDVDGNASDLMYSELKYSLVIRRNSSLYMQSMLFPSILLTSVALLGFYLPPDSGERVGLQITILLTFMVFLLTVGEMFPASTGPYIGVYFVLSMGQLGVNILMTITVLHIHFKPCVRDPTTWKSQREGGQKEAESMIPVNLRRFLQFCNRYIAIAEPGAAWMLPITKSPLPELKTEPVRKLEVDKPVVENEVNAARSDDDDKDGGTKNGVKPAGETMRMLNEEAEYGVQVITPTKTEKKRLSTDIFRRSKSPSKSPAKSPAGRNDALQQMINEFRLNVKDIVEEGVEKKLHEKDTEEEMEESMEKEQEEWKSVARAVDKLFFRLYVLLMLVSYAALGGVALQAHFDISTDLNAQ